MTTRNYLDYRRSSVAGYQYLEASCLFRPSDKIMLTQILYRGDYADFETHSQYIAVWKEYIPRYRLIKVSSAFRVKFDTTVVHGFQTEEQQRHTMESFHNNRLDLFALECLEDESYAVFVGSITHVNSQYNSKVNNLRRAFVNNVLDWQISKDEEMLLKLSI